MSSLLDLAERCEKATGPDRQLDLDIINAITSKSGWFWHDDRHETISRNDYGHGAPGNPICSLDPHTSFIDYALELVPEGWQWSVSNRARAPHAGRAYIHNNELINIGGGMTPNPKYRGAEVTAATPALALCAAGLRARHSLAAVGAAKQP